jgi:hypothetical protein
VDDDLLGDDYVSEENYHEGRVDNGLKINVE